MCQAHGTECIFPHPDDDWTRQSRSPTLPRNSPARVVARPLSRQSGGGGPLTNGAIQFALPQPIAPLTANRQIASLGSATQVESRHLAEVEAEEHRAGALSNLVGIVAEAGDDSSHIVSPAVAGDDDILESYLSSVPTTRRRFLAPTSPSGGTLRPVRFNVVPRRPLGVPAMQSLAAAKCEIIEKLMGPDVDEYLRL